MRGNALEYIENARLTVGIKTARPGLVIGRKGEQVDKLSEEMKSLTKKVVQEVKAVLQENKVANMAIGVDEMDVYLLDALRDAGFRVCNGYDAMFDARLIKSPEELQLIEQSASLVDGVYANVVDFIRPGVRENEVVSKIAGWLIEHGCTPTGQAA